MKNEEFCPQLQHLSSNRSFDWHFWGKTVVWGLKRSQDCGGERQWRSAVADEAAHLCSSVIRLICLGRWQAASLLLCAQTPLLPHALWGAKMPNHLHALPRQCLAAVGHLHSQLRGTRAGSWKWRKSFWQPFAVLVAWCLCLRQLKRALQRGRAQVCEQGSSLEDNPAHHECEKALHKPVSERVWDIQAPLHLRWVLDDRNHSSEKSSGNNYVGFFFWWNEREHSGTFFFSPISCYPNNSLELVHKICAQQHGFYLDQCSSTITTLPENGEICSFLTGWNTVSLAILAKSTGHSL